MNKNRALIARRKTTNNSFSFEMMNLDFSFRSNQTANYSPQEYSVLCSIEHYSSVCSSEYIRTFPFFEIIFNYETLRLDSGQQPGLGDSYDGLVTDGIDLEQILTLKGSFETNQSVAIHLCFDNVYTLKILEG